jgi:hypothetical protein
MRTGGNHGVEQEEPAARRRDRLFDERHSLLLERTSQASRDASQYER